MRTIGWQVAAFLVLGLAAGCGGGSSGGSDPAKPDVPIVIDAGPDTAGDVAATDPGRDEAGGTDLPGDPGSGDVEDDVADAPGPDTTGCPGNPMCACEAASECFSGLCIDTMSARVCTGLCSGGESDACPKGWRCELITTSGDPQYFCIDPFAQLCRPCMADADCVPAFGAGNRRYACLDRQPLGRFCGGECADDAACPDGFSCDAVDVGGTPVKMCVPTGGAECPCTAKFKAHGYKTVCSQTNGFGTCSAERTCDVPCSAPIPAAEACNEVDDDCNGKTDEGLGGEPCDLVNEHGTCPGTTACVAGKPSCTGTAAKPESCNGLDDDCDGDTDETGAAGCQNLLKDADHDGWGLEGDSTCVCTATAPYTAIQGGDCDDGDAAVHPQGTESCNGKDDDCNGQTDEDGAGGCVTFFMDADRDGYGTAASSACKCHATPPYDAEEAGDCNDGDPAVFPTAAEICNGRDDNCDGFQDPEGAAGCSTYFRDNDGDGYGLDGDAKCLCAATDKYTATRGGDCADADVGVFPGATEVCNGKDDDCNGTTDPAGAGGCKTYLRDADGDGAGVDGDTVCTCAPQYPYTATAGGDCDDGDAGVRPGAAEACNDKDDDCDGLTDEAGATGCTVYFKDADGDGWGLATDSRCLCEPDVAGKYTMSNPAKATDCCDTDATAYPGASAFYTVRNKCGEWDYNCDKNAEKELTTLGNCAWGACNYTAGWETSIPECGQNASFVNSCTWILTFCQWNTGSKTQRCR